MIMISILIPTTPARVRMFRDLSDEIARQYLNCSELHPLLGCIEIISDNSKPFLEGGLSIGKKRGALVQRAIGKYLCFVDSDDWIAPNYIESLLRLCQHNTDIVSFRNISKFENYWCVVDQSIHFTNDGASPNYIVRRKPAHICPVRSEFAKLYAFDDSNYGEDASWMDKVLRHCTTEIKTEQILHEYRHGSHSESDKIIRLTGSTIDKDGQL